MSILKSVGSYFERRAAGRGAARVGREAALDEAASIMVKARQKGEMTNKDYQRISALRRMNGLCWEDFSTGKGEVNDLNARYLGNNGKRPIDV